MYKRVREWEWDVSFNNIPWRKILDAVAYQAGFVVVEEPGDIIRLEKIKNHKP